MIAPKQESYQLWHKGALALAKVERNGIRVDTDYLTSAISETRSKIAGMEGELASSKPYRTWKKMFGDKTNLDSNKQLVKVLSGMGYEWSEEDVTEKGQLKADEITLAKLDDPFVNALLKWKEQNKLCNTFLEGIRRETVDGFLHPFFDLHTTVSTRGSSSWPNFQNFPNHDPYQRNLIRKCFVPRTGRVLIEVDYGALEFKIAADVWEDEAMIEYATHKDVHKTCAAMIFKCKPEQVSKPMRQVAKNMFVFPLLYGDYYIHCAIYIWNEVKKLSLMDGTPVKQWLKSRQITKLGVCNPRESPGPDTFEKHVKICEEKFLGMFPEFAEGKEIAWEDYQKTGAFRLITGFVCRGIYKKNKVLNYRVQGPGFHCLLQDMVWIMEELEQRKMESLVVGEIHDCLLGDVPYSEIQDFLNICERVMVRKLPKRWPWLIVPMSIEVDVVEEDSSWADKLPWIKQDSKWIPLPKKAA